MNDEFLFEDKTEFLEKLQHLLREGVSSRDIDVIMPYPVHEVEEILHPRPSALRVFTLLGALAGLVTGFAFTIFTVKDWPLITGGKPLVSIPPFTIIAFALTILFGALISFGGFLILARLPSLKAMADPVEYGNHFVILINRGE